ncbi:MAG: glycolate oxidase subunit GlcE [Ectothiorhodospiraceae bacterium]|jgi:glycolate oxidase FAD binding subunit|nr:glycolate oxidase subunit GlcE [Ectothiorhodospiraceae bacterium]
MTDIDERYEALADRVRDAAARGRALTIRGGGTKAFYGRRPAEDADVLDLRELRGVVAYEPTELVVTVRTGTPLAEVEALLAEQGQRLPFEPPHFGDGATIGGAVAAGLSGPRRPWGGAVRDALLGVRIVNGRGETLKFGGQVMKNVAGYDVSRLMAGSLGTLGVLLEVSLKVTPRAPLEITLVHELDEAEAIERLAGWSHHALAMTGTCHHDGRLYLRVCGGERALEAARRAIGGDLMPQAEGFWSDLREQRHAFFAGEPPLWRLSLPPATPPLGLGTTLHEWAGAQRWLRTDATAETIHETTRRTGGHATLFRGHDGTGEAFAPLPDALAALHRRVKQAMDPQGIFNRGRMYGWL